MSGIPLRQSNDSQRIEAVCSRCSLPVLLTRDALRKQRRQGRKPVCGECGGRNSGPIDPDDRRAYRREYTRLCVYMERYGRENVLAWRAENNPTCWLRFEEWKQRDGEDYASWWRERFSSDEIRELAGALVLSDCPDHSRPATGRKQRRTESNTINEPLWNGRAPSQTPLKRKQSSAASAKSCFGTTTRTPKIRSDLHAG